MDLWIDQSVDTVLGGFLGPLGALLGPSGGLLDPLGGSLGASWAPLGGLLGLLGPSWAPPWAPRVSTWRPRGPNNGFRQKSSRSGEHFGGYVWAFFGTFSHHFLDCFFERVLVSNLFNFGALLEPRGT